MPFVVSQSGGQVAFNGGTITSGLAITDANVAHVPLAITVPGTGPTGDTISVTDGATARVDLIVGNPAAELDLYDASGGTGAALLGSAGIDVTSDGSSRVATFRDSGGSRRLVVSTGAYLLILSHAAPADGDIAAGESALWFDQTNGAAKLMVKAKQADGTVRTGSLALT